MMKFTIPVLLVGLLQGFAPAWAQVPDGFEDNDTPQSAGFIVVAGNVEATPDRYFYGQVHNFVPAGDPDWIQFPAGVGDGVDGVYFIRVFTGDPTLAINVEVYDEDILIGPDTPIAQVSNCGAPNDDFTLTVNNPTVQILYVMIENCDAGSPGADYEVRIGPQVTPFDCVLTYGRVTVAGSGEAAELVFVHTDPDDNVWDISKPDGLGSFALCHGGNALTLSATDTMPGRYEQLNVDLAPYDLFNLLGDCLQLDLIVAPAGVVFGSGFEDGEGPGAGAVLHNRPPDPFSPPGCGTR